jgi:hypothetical protein
MARFDLVGSREIETEGRPSRPPLCTPPPLSAAADYRLANRVTLGARLDSEFASHSQTYAGTGRVNYTW